jgi:hypothetical protein
MRTVLTRSSKGWRVEDDSASYKSKERSLIIGVIIIFAVYFVVSIMYNLQSILSIFLIPSNSILAPYVERIAIKSTSVVKLAHEYFVTINFVNDGDRNTSIDSVLLNGIPYNDPRWTGTVKPLVFGDITPNTRINTSVQYDPNPPLLSGMIIFSDDCRDPNGNKLIASWYDQYYVNVTIRTYMGFNYDTSITLPQGPVLQNAPSPVMMSAIAIMAVIAFITLFIIARRRTRIEVIKHDSASPIDRRSEEERSKAQSRARIW